MKCPVFWGSHGCNLDRDHDGQHWCTSCCRSDDAAHMRKHLTASASQYGTDGCAGTWPYYGWDKMAGPEADFQFFNYEAPEWQFVYLPDEFERLAALR